VADSREAYVQSKLIDGLTKRGWWARKITSPSRNGIPDVVCARDGRVIWIEVKRDGDRKGPTRDEMREMRIMREHGLECRVVTGRDEVNKFLSEITGKEET
jgi:hypothetical protein